MITGAVSHQKKKEVITGVLAMVVRINSPNGFRTCLLGLMMTRSLLNYATLTVKLVLLPLLQFRGPIIDETARA